MRFSFPYINFPNSKELTDKSRMIGRMTHPVVSLAIAAILMVLGGKLIQSESFVMPWMMFCFVVFIAGWILLAKYRKKRFEQLKEEYKKMMGSN